MDKYLRLDTTGVLITYSSKTDKTYAGYELSRAFDNLHDFTFHEAGRYELNDCWKENSSMFCPWVLLANEDNL